MTDRKTNISIILPFKNTALFLPECFKSIIDQTYIHWELIAIDDNSTDDSAHIVAKYAKGDNRIKLVCNKGEGIISALQTGYAISSGNYITRMDSDDIMHKSKLETMLYQLKKAGSEHIALGLVQYFSEKELGNGYIQYQDWLNKLTVKGNNFDGIYKECPIPSPCWMVHRNDFEKAGGFSSNIYPEDYDLTFRFYQSELKCIPTNNVLHFWRDYSERTSRNDENYADNNYLHLKVKYFAQIDWDKNKQVVLWGAGKRGKHIAQLLQKQNIPFCWITNNEKKIGKDIYEVRIEDLSNQFFTSKHQILLSVASPDDKKGIANTISQHNLKENANYFWFC